MKLEEKMRIQTEQLENHLKQEKIAREALEQSAKEAEEKAKADMQYLRNELQKANREREELNEKYARHSQSAGCMILWMHNTLLYCIYEYIAKPKMYKMHGVIHDELCA